MDLSKIKNLVKQNGDKFIFVDNGEPEVVMMSWREYQKLAGHNANVRTYANNANGNHYRAGLADLGSEHLQETEFIAPVLVEPIGLPVRLEDIRLEDLPI